MQFFRLQKPPTPPDKYDDFLTKRVIPGSSKHITELKSNMLLFVYYDNLHDVSSSNLGAGAASPQQIPLVFWLF